MAEFIHTHSARVVRPDGTPWEARTCGEKRTDGTWIGWLEFRPVGAPATPNVPALLRTGRETSQPDRKALVYWACGLERVYLDGAFSRALSRGEPPSGDNDELHGTSARDTGTR